MDTTVIVTTTDGREHRYDLQRWNMTLNARHPVLGKQCLKFWSDAEGYETGRKFHPTERWHVLDHVTMVAYEKDER